MICDVTEDVHMAGAVTARQSDVSRSAAHERVVRASALSRGGEAELIMSIDLMFVLATAAFAWGVALVIYRWSALHNTWPMGVWHAEQPWLPRAIGVGVIAAALLFALARGYATALVLPLLGVLAALCWTAILKVGAQSALLLGPAAVVFLLLGWAIGAV